MNFVCPCIWCCCPMEGISTWSLYHKFCDYCWDTPRLETQKILDQATQEIQKTKLASQSAETTPHHYVDMQTLQSTDESLWHSSKIWISNAMICTSLAAYVFNCLSFTTCFTTCDTIIDSKIPLGLSVASLVAAYVPLIISTSFHYCQDFLTNRTLERSLKETLSFKPTENLTAQQDKKLDCLLKAGTVYKKMLRENRYISLSCLINTGIAPVLGAVLPVAYGALYYIISSRNTFNINYLPWIGATVAYTTTMCVLGGTHCFTRFRIPKKAHQILTNTGLIQAPAVSETTPLLNQTSPV